MKFKVHVRVVSIAVFLAAACQSPALASPLTSHETVDSALAGSPLVAKAAPGPSNVSVDNSGTNFSLPGGIPLKAPQFTGAVHSRAGTTSVKGPEDAQLAHLRIGPAESQHVVAITGPNAPKSFVFDLDLPDTATLTLKRTGEVVATSADGIPLAVVDAPWAHEANGQPVKTSYTVSGHRITQTVDHSAAGVEYPVLADPKVTNCAPKFKVPTRVCVTFSKGEVKKINAKYKSGYAEMASLACEFIKGKGRAGTAVRLGCKAAIVVVAWKFKKLIRAALKSKRCVQIRFGYDAQTQVQIKEMYLIQC